MGENLLLNLESRGYTVTASDPTPDKVEACLHGRARGNNIRGADTASTIL